MVAPIAIGPNLEMIMSSSCCRQLSDSEDGVVSADFVKGATVMGA